MTASDRAAVAGAADAARHYRDGWNAPRCAEKGCECQFCTVYRRAYYSTWNAVARPDHRVANPTFGA